MQTKNQASAIPSPASVTVDQLAAWLALEDQVRKRIPADRAHRPADRSLSGLHTMQAMLRGELAPPPIADTLDFLLLEVGPGTAVFQGRPLQRHYNPLGSVHGGWFATLLDSAMGCAVHTMMPPGRGYTTAELSVNIVRAITDKVPRVRAQGRVIHCGRQLATAEAQLLGPDGRLYAHGTTTCLVFELPTGNTEQGTVSPTRA